MDLIGAPLAFIAVKAGYGLDVSMDRFEFKGGGFLKVITAGDDVTRQKELYAGIGSYQIIYDID